jgi:ribosomal protein S1
MADNSIKQMPPRFLEVGKEIKVRVFSINESKRSMEFTKKDTLMKDDAPVY